jgi:hypothetical protein
MRAPVRSLRSGLRSRFLTAIAAGSALASVGLSGACGGAVEGVSGSSSGGEPKNESSPTNTTGGGSTSSSSSGSSSGNPSPPSTPTPNPPATDASVPPGKCDWGKPEQACYTTAQLESIWYSPPMGGDVATDAGPPPWDSNGCLPMEHVKDDCCNPAVSGPIKSGNTCCYVHCTGGCCGRPFVVEGEARTARIAPREDWLGATGGPAHRFAVEALPADARARLGKAWANDAAMEHASVAAFARFTLELLAVGAPPEILLDAQDATRDEIEHARACFTMASRYLGRAVGPDALDTSGAGGPRSLAEIAAATVKEGCIGETLSAALAEERARGAAHPYTRSVLDRIADDEARHAELAWRFIGWAIATGGETVRGAVARAIDETFARPPVAFDAALAAVDSETVRAHGLLDEETARETVARALREIVAPCAAASIDTRRAA